MKTKYTDRISTYIKERKYALVKGDVMEEFENKAAKLFGNKYGVSTCNGTSAIFLSLVVLKTLRGKSEVIIANYGFHSDASLICAAGLTPIFCDVKPETFTIDFNECEKLINDKTLAVLVLQPWGNVADLDEVQRLRKKYNIAFISDSSHAHGALWKDKPIGGYFDINCASFGMGKLISGGELGIFSTDNAEYCDLAMLYSHTNRVPKDLLMDKYKNISNSVGIKFRPHLFALLIALDEFETYSERLEIIKKNIGKVKKEFSGSNSVSFVKSYGFAKRVFWKLEIILKSMIDSHSLIAKLNEAEVLSEKHNYRVPLSQSTIITDFYSIITHREFPNTNSITSLNLIQIPFQIFENDEKVSKLIKLLKTF